VDDGSTKEAAAAAAEMDIAAHADNGLADVLIWRREQWRGPSPCEHLQDWAQHNAVRSLAAAACVNPACKEPAQCLPCLMHFLSAHFHDHVSICMLATKTVALHRHGACVTHSSVISCTYHCGRLADNQPACMRSCRSPAMRCGAIPRSTRPPASCRRAASRLHQVRLPQHMHPSSHNRTAAFTGIKLQPIQESKRSVVNSGRD
jgi:hypothetical protein